MRLIIAAIFFVTPLTYAQSGNVRWTPVSEFRSKVKRCLEPVMREVHAEYYSKLPAVRDIHADQNTLNELKQHYENKTRQLVKLGDLLPKTIDMTFTFVPGSQITQLRGKASWKISYDVAGENNHYTAELHPFDFDWAISSQRLTVNFPGLGEPLTVSGLAQYGYNGSAGMRVRQEDGKMKVERAYSNMRFITQGYRTIYFRGKSMTVVNLGFNVGSLEDCLRLEFR